MKKLLKYSIAILLAMGGVSGLSIAQSTDAVLGKWLTNGGRSHIEIYKPAGKNLYFGKIVWLDEPVDEQGRPMKDVNGNVILNMELLKGFAYDDGEWSDGTIYDPESGKIYHCTLELDGRNTLKVRGSLDSWGLLGRTESWTRVQ
jgi:uncharacterized protein (DUF2147 family)